MPKASSRDERGGERQASEESSDWLTLADIARIVGKPYGTVYGWRKTGRLPAPSAPHGHSPLWLRRTIEKWRREVMPTSVDTGVTMSLESGSRMIQGEARMSRTASRDYRTAVLDGSCYIIFTQRELATRWGSDPSQITRWRKSGEVPNPNALSASGREIGWTLSSVAQFEATHPKFAARAKRVRGES